jgi:multiple sugar transport system permease protein
LTGLFSPKNVFLWPALLVVLALSIFPLIVSLYLSLSRLRFTASGIDIRLIGFSNFQVLLFGSEQVHLVGLLKPPTLVGWALFVLLTGLLVLAFGRAARGGVRPLGLLLRAIGGLLGIGLAWLLVSTTFSDGGRPGTLFVTLTYVFVGLVLQYALGLGLAMLVTQHLPGRRFFRIVFLLPMMITPVGVAYLFQMLTDTGKGPFLPIFQAVGLGNFTWTTDPWLARTAVMIGDIWQWTPFLFIVLLAALEGQDQEVLEAAHVDGASRWQAFRHITIPAILPVSTTVVLIRMIEAFKIVDLPNILTNGGPGTATESLTLQAFFDWRTQALGRSAALAYILLIIVTIAATAYVNLVRRRVTVNA